MRSSGYKRLILTKTSIARLVTTTIISTLLTACGGGSSSEDSSTEPTPVTPPITNNAPIANAGTDQTVSTGDVVTLSASQSADADGDELTYSWSISSVPGGSTSSLTSSSASTTAFTADSTGSYTISLVVNDGTVDSSADSVTIVATTTDDGNTDTTAFTLGLATTTINDLFSSGARVAAVGTITDEDNTSWTVPAEVRYNDDTMPLASDLHNVYQSGHDYDTAALALADLDGSDIIEVDAGGEVITAYIFADNYFEIYINGTAVGKDPIPFTDFNSNIVRFRVNQPFTVAMLLVDWEENLGTGTENNQGSDYHPGDGGMVAVFKDSNGQTIAVTDNSWKAQTYYTAPITDSSCLTQSNNQRLSSNCSTDAPASADNIIGAHWSRPANWTSSSFDDSDWPSAVTFTNDTVGVDNKASYTNFTDIFDDNSNDAQFIWSSNLILDNEVLVRASIGSNNNGMTLSSDALKTNRILPMDATCDGANQGSFITLDWGNAPSGTQSFAITMHNYANANDEGDLSKAHSYQVLYDIPANSTSLATGATGIGTFGINGVDGEQSYSAPCSQSPIDNDYIFTLYALSAATDTLGLNASSTDIVTLTDAISDSTLEAVTLTTSRVRYNTNSDDHVPVSVPSDCATKSAAFDAYSDFVSVSCDSTTMTVTTNTFLPYRSALDGDKANVGIKSWIGRVPIAEQASWTLPLQPSYISSTTSNLNIHDAIGISVEGIPILHYAKENSADEVAQLGTDYSDRDTVILGEIDQCGAHAGNGEDYHYHMAPLCMMDSHDPSQPLAYMFDGIPLYFGTAGGTASNGDTNYGAGRYTDLNYLPQNVKTGDRPLDECNAYDLHGDGSEYVYYTTTEPPYTIGCYRGSADQSSSVPSGPHWSEERDLSWAGSDVELTDHDAMTFDNQSWSFIEITPGDTNNSIANGDKARIIYRQLNAGDDGYQSNSDCYTFRYRLDSSNTSGSNDTVSTHCR